MANNMAKKTIEEKKIEEVKEILEQYKKDRESVIPKKLLERHKHHLPGLEPKKTRTLNHHLSNAGSDESSCTLSHLLSLVPEGSRDSSEIFAVSWESYGDSHVQLILRCEVPNENYEDEMESWKTLKEYSSLCNKLKKLADKRWLQHQKKCKTDQDYQEYLRLKKVFESDK